jgi:hypothetical protein
VIATPTGVFDEAGRSIARSPTDTPLAVACGSTEADVTLLISDGVSVWSLVQRERASSLDDWTVLEDIPCRRVVSLALGSSGSDEVASTVVAGVDDTGDGGVWLARSGRWHRIATGPVAAGVVSLASVPGPRGVYAAMGDTVFRPATVGELLLAPEHPASVEGEPIHGLAAVRRPDGDVVAALTGNAVYLSRSGGILWDRIDLPPGPPGTAMSIRNGPALEVVIACLGGDLVALPLD